MRPPIIYHGMFGSGMFQTLYTSQPVGLLSFFSSLEYHVLVTLPLLVLSSTFRWLLPLAVASLALSFVVCIAAAVQAEFPRKKQRWWSRPVVALLFFLQPIVRGWARYQGQLVSSANNSPAAETFDSVNLRGGYESLNEVRYWANQPVDRIAFVSSILESLDQQDWPNQPDIGWSQYDVQVYGNRWTYLQLTTVAEDYPKGKQMIRCRLRTKWSLQAKAAFWGAFGFELLLCGIVGKWLPWLWLLLLTIPLFAWFLAREKRNQQSLMVVFLDEVAKRWSLIKVPAAAEVEKPKPVTGS